VIARNLWIAKEETLHYSDDDGTTSRQIARLKPWGTCFGTRKEVRIQDTDL